jgi:hypothetical protein
MLRQLRDIQLQQPVPIPLLLILLLIPLEQIVPLQLLRPLLHRRHRPRSLHQHVLHLLRAQPYLLLRHRPHPPLLRRHLLRQRRVLLHHHLQILILLLLQLAAPLSSQEFVQPLLELLLIDVDLLLESAQPLLLAFPFPLLLLPVFALLHC